MIASWLGVPRAHFLIKAMRAGVIPVDGVLDADAAL